MGPDATGLNQQGHTELHKKTTSLCESWDGHLTTMNIEGYKRLSISLA